MKSTAEVTDKLAIKPIYKDIIGQKILEEFDNTHLLWVLLQELIPWKQRNEKKSDFSNNQRCVE